MNDGHPSRFQPWRRLAFFLQASVIIGLPFVRVGGESAFRFDVPTLLLHFFGHTLWMQEFFLFLLVTLWFTFVIVLATTVLGRLWCGWLCPQSALLELVDWVGDVIRLGPAGRHRLRHPFIVVLSGLVSATLVWYFVEPGDFFRTLRAPFFSGTKSKVVWGFFLSQWVVIYAEIALLGRRFCATICPYGKLQGALFDADTLVIEYDRTRNDDCRTCDICVRVCPTGIDIKDGLRVECIACARCIDACGSMTAPRGIPSLVSYRWGGWRRLVRPQVLAVALAISLLSGGILWWISARRPVSVTISRPPGALFRKTPGGTILNRYRVHLQNKEAEPVRVSMIVEPDRAFHILGPREVLLAGESDRVVSVVIAPRGELPGSTNTIALVVEIVETGERFRLPTVFYGPASGAAAPGQGNE